MSGAQPRKPLIAGNWKMNLDHVQATAFLQELRWFFKDEKFDGRDFEVAVFPPFTDLRSAQTVIVADKMPLALGAQDVSPQAPGAFTGDIAAPFLRKLDVRYVIVGHSERRAGYGETDETVGQKAAAVAAAGMVPVICVGETAADLEEHGAAAVPVAQMAAARAHLSENAEFVIAYEPVWAIGSGQAATAEQAQQVCGALRAKLANLRGETAAASTRILYGGSVTAENITGFLAENDIDGALIGGASIKISDFTSILRYTGK
ncbi:MAG: triose-phosphate isomerase [Microbacteriaceae bacterium]|nr:triose-phosphate isomerase [Microbacteriaceae bacterium]